MHRVGHGVEREPLGDNVHGHLVGTQPDPEHPAARVLGGHLDTRPAGAAHPADRVDGGGDRQRQPAPPAGVDGRSVTGAGKCGVAGWCRSLDPGPCSSPSDVDVQVVDVDVDLDHLQAGHALDPLDHVLADGVGGLHDGLAVITDDVDIDAAWRSPTSTDTPWAVAADAPGTLERIDPNARDMLLPMAWTPGISWVARAAILATTDDEIEVVPCSVLSAAPPPATGRAPCCVTGPSALRDGAWSAVERGGRQRRGWRVSEGARLGLGFRAWRFLLGRVDSRG